MGCKVYVLNQGKRVMAGKRQENGQKRRAEDHPVHPVVSGRGDGRSADSEGRGTGKSGLDKRKGKDLRQTGNADGKQVAYDICADGDNGYGKELPYEGERP
jgi:hypothetical protein